MRTLMILIASLLMSFTAQAEWVTELTEDPMTDEARAIVVNIGEGDKKVFLRCGSYDTDKLNIFIYWGGDYFSDDDKRIKYRFDKDAPQSVTVNLSSSSTSLFLSDSIERDFLSRMKSASRLVIQASPYSEGIQTLVVDLSGFTAAYNKHCPSLAGPGPAE